MFPIWHIANQQKTGYSALQMPLVNAAITMGQISLGFSLFKSPRGPHWRIWAADRKFDTLVLEVISTEYILH